MKEHTTLQRVTNALESASIGVTCIEIWPPEEDGRVSVSVVVRPRPDPICLIGIDPDNQDHKTAVINSLNAAKLPDDPPAVPDPCGECAQGNCGDCQIKDGKPVKLYSPWDAAIAMLAGRTLLNQKQRECFWREWENGDCGFYENDDIAGYAVLANFSGLYEEAKYV
ncbi:MAG: hypothetical protein LBT95_02125 [Treponema sp.]|jgi:hypothetical protein|nr:hypothetical protein [Treponema sp.]